MASSFFSMHSNRIWSGWYGLYWHNFCFQLEKFHLKFHFYSTPHSNLGLSEKKLKIYSNLSMCSSLFVAKWWTQMHGSMAGIFGSGINRWPDVRIQRFSGAWANAKLYCFTYAERQSLFWLATLYVRTCVCVCALICACQTSTHTQT